MKIKEVKYDVKVDEYVLVFDNGNCIIYEHDQDCCEHNYADFTQLEEAARDYDFDVNLIFEKVDNYGFRFGDKNRMFGVPCYSDQSGYYTTQLNIYYVTKKLGLSAQLRTDY